MTEPADEPAVSGRAAYGSVAAQWWACAVLTLVYGCHAIDRNMPNILLEPIRHEFKLSDSQLGAFTGFAYAISFSLTVLPVGWITDRVNRRNFLAAIIVGWSAFTALSGMARSYLHLVAARVGIGVTESGAAPAAMSMITDIFPERQRGRALGLFYISQALGQLVAGTVGGFVAATYGWRAAFLIAGVPGLILAVVMLTTIREPRRGGAEAAEHVGVAPKVHEVFQFLWRTPGLVVLILGCACLGMINLSIAAWLGSFFIRIHHLDLKQAGLVLGLASGLGAMVGAPLQGWLSDRLQGLNRRWPLWLVAIASTISMIAGFWMLFTGSVVVAIVCIIIGDLCRMGYAPPTYSLFMTRTPPRLRGAAMSIMQLTTNVFGFAIGPVFVGVLSDYYGGGTSLRFAMAWAIGFTAVVVVLMLLATRLLFGTKAQPVVAAAS